MKCSCCNDETPTEGLFAPCGEAAKTFPTMCFACIFVYTLRGVVCVFCGQEGCGAIIAVQTESDSRVVPAAVCPQCLPDQDQGEDVVLDSEPTKGRQLITQPFNEQ